MKSILIFLVGVLITGCAGIQGNSEMNELPDFNSKWNYGDPASTRVQFEEIQRETANSGNLNYSLELQTQIARTYSLQAEFVEAHKVLDKVESALTVDTKVAKVRYYLERGRSFNSANIKDRARQSFISAFELAKEIGAESYEIDAAHMMAIAAEKFEEKVMWNEKGLAAALEAKTERGKKWQGSFLNNLGWDYFAEKKYESALQRFKECEKYYSDDQESDRFRIARWSIAKTLRVMGQTSEALSMQLELLKQKNGEDKSGYTFEELGELYLLDGNKSESKKYFAKAYEVLSKDTWLQKNEADRLERIKGLSLNQ